MSVIGGLRTLWGAVVGSAVIVALQQTLQVVVPLVLPSARGDFQSLFFGIILIAMLIFVPRGIAGRPQVART
jgi:branched-chain amino acid transport system permease protein